MPACYAHYRFGSEMISMLPKNIQSIIREYRSTYDLGTHGPDIFFYHNPFYRTEIVDKAYAIHRLTGKNFFTNAIARLESKQSNQAIAYLFGVLSHYALDSYCHPLIHEWDDLDISKHVETESEFDRFLLEKDGEVPHYYDQAKHLKWTRRDAEIIEKVYEISFQKIARSCSNFVLITRLLSPTGKFTRTFTEAVLKPIPSIYAYLIPKGKSRKERDTDDELMKQYQSARKLYPRLAEQLADCIQRGLPLGEEFDRIFG